MNMHISAPHPDAAAIVHGALASAIRPPRRISPSTWCAQNLIVADGPLAGRKWSPDLTPQLVEIIDCLDPAHPCNIVAFRKSAQVGATGIGIGWLLYMAAQHPSRSMLIMPTLTAVQDYNREKLQPTIDATPAVRRLIQGYKSRASGSTTTSKRYPGGSLTLTGANSSVDLRSKTTQYQHRDEIDDWPADLEGQGDPEEMADARMISFLSSGDWKVFKTSTPTIRGISRIDAAFEAGDQRYWMVRCPHCGHEQRLEFGGRDKRHGLKFSSRPPYNAHYVCAGSGCIIEAHERRDMIMGGRWVAHNPDGQYPSFHLDALSSLMVPWDKIAENFLAARDNPQKLKGFVNLWLGESWEERGEAPEWELLLARVEDIKPGSRPADALLITCAVDVQKDGLFYEVTGWGADKQSWSLDAGFLPGATADPSAQVWRDLTELAERRYTDPWGRSWKADLIGVDAGYNTAAVLRWTSRRADAMALKGVPGWFKPAIGTPSAMQVTRSGRRRKGRSKVWPVGTWPLKSELYALLRKPGKRAGEESDPPGYCHFGRHNDERYFRQLTAEHIRERQARGRVIKEWVAIGDNHFHDCRIYGLALFDRLGGNRMTSDQWAALAAERGAQQEDDLLSLSFPSAAARPPAGVKEKKEKPPALLKRRRRGGWMS